MAAARLGLHAAGRTPRAAHEQNERRGDRGQAKRRRSSHACHLGHDAEPEANEQNREPGPQQRQPRQARAKEGSTCHRPRRPRTGGSPCDVWTSMSRPMVSPASSRAPDSTMAIRHTGQSLRLTSGWATIRSSSPPTSSHSTTGAHSRWTRGRRRSRAGSGSPPRAPSAPPDELHVRVDLGCREPPAADSQAESGCSEEDVPQAEAGSERERHRGSKEGPDVVLLGWHRISVVRR
jgi:hypothetical protein